MQEENNHFGTYLIMNNVGEFLENYIPNRQLSITGQFHNALFLLEPYAKQLLSTKAFRDYHLVHIEVSPSAADKINALC